MAVFIGAVELLGLLAHDANLSGSGWSFLEDFNINTAGFVIVGVFVLTWIVALCIWRFGRIEQKWEAGRPLVPDSSNSLSGTTREGHSMRIAAWWRILRLLARGRRTDGDR